MNKLIALALVLLSFAAQADFTGTVVKVSDGDTIKVIDGQRHLHTVRLTGIDAPEKTQDYGLESRDNLRDMILQKSVTVETGKSDRYGRELGKVLLGDTDVNLAQVKAGLAWHYKKYERDQTTEDRVNYLSAEKEARAFNYGLWRSDNPIPPWDFRKGTR